MNEPIPHTTRETSRYAADGAGNWREVELAALSSVEVGRNAKGTAYVMSAKAYHNDPLEAARLAVAAFNHAEELLLTPAPNEATP